MSRDGPMCYGMVPHGSQDGPVCPRMSQGVGVGPPGYPGIFIGPRAPVSGHRGHLGPGQAGCMEHRAPVVRFILMHSDIYHCTLQK